MLPQPPATVTDARSPAGTSPSRTPGERRRRQFLRFSETECTNDPLYVALCRLLADRPQALALLDRAPLTQQRPNLLLAAIHERVLAGFAGELAVYFPSAGGRRPIDAALGAALDGVLADQWPALAAHCEHRQTQTNEIGRCAVLWPALSHVACLTGKTRLALLDFGCSAGLNLGVDRYIYADGDGLPNGLAAPGTPRIVCRPVHGGSEPPVPAQVEVVARIGIDPAPVNLAQAAQRRWLRACIWPSEEERARRFELAAEIVLAQRWTIRREPDCAAAIEPWLDSLPKDVQPVVFNSWVLAYFEAAALESHLNFMRGLVQRRGLVWISAEGPGLLLGPLPPAGPGDDKVSSAELANGSLWWLTLPGPDSAPVSTLLARSHPHGRWVQWV